MNGKRAKQLRALAGVNKSNRNSRSYAGTNVVTKKALHPTDIDANGNPIVLGTYQTATYVLNECARKLNKMLKENYKRMSRASTRNMLVA